MTAMRREAAKGHVSNMTVIAAVLQRVRDRTKLDEAAIKRELHGLLRKAARDRTLPVRRAWLTREQMKRVIVRINEEIGFAFAFQTLFMLRWSSLQQLEARDVRVSNPEGTVCLDIIIRREKAPSDVGARVIRGMPLNMRLVRRASEYWTPVMLELRRRVQRATSPSEPVIDKRWCGNSAAYGRYLTSVKTMITAWAGTATEVHTHDARRTGAYLHLSEGWPLRLIASVGGWSLTDHTSLIRYLGRGLDVLTWANVTE